MPVGSSESTWKRSPVMFWVISARKEVEARILRDPVAAAGCMDGADPHAVRKRAVAANTLRELMSFFV